MAGPPPLTRFAWLSIAAALVTIGLKTGAYVLTGSVGLLSDAAESLVNLVGALMALAMLAVAARPADDEHAYGHSKAEYFSSGLEGGLILVAAVGIAIAAVGRLLQPRPLVSVEIGAIVSAVASAVNLGTAAVLFRAGRRHHSVTLVANAHHLMTDVWTSVGVIVGILLVQATGWHWLDPVSAFLVAANIVFTGVRIVNESVHGLMDAALPPAELEAVEAALRPYVDSGIEYHALRTRRAGARRFVFLHVLVPGDWTVDRGHELMCRIEADISAVLIHAHVSTHLEPLHNPVSFEDEGIDPPSGPAGSAPGPSA